MMIKRIYAENVDHPRKFVYMIVKTGRQYIQGSRGNLHAPPTLAPKTGDGHTKDLRVGSTYLVTVRPCGPAGMRT